MAKNILLSLERNRCASWRDHVSWDATFTNEGQTHAISARGPTHKKAIQMVVESLLTSQDGKKLLNAISNDPLSQDPLIDQDDLHIEMEANQ